MTGDSGDGRHCYAFRLFVSGTSPRSLRAIANLRKVCDGALLGRCTLEVINLYEDPVQARRDQVVAAPTLVKVAPDPRRMLIGDLSDTDRLLASLGIATATVAGRTVPRA